MKGDYSRFSFDSKKHYRAVLMQQGRLQLDADWNEQVQIAEHRYSRFFRDLLGRSGTPKSMAMKLELSEKGVLILSEGVYYVDGLLIENDKDKEVNLKEIDLGIPSDKEIYLYYLDVWAREVSAAEDEALIDPAVGVETTTRLKTEWTIHCQLVGEKVRELQEIFRKGDWPVETGKSDGLLKRPIITSSDDWWRPLSTGRMQIGSLETWFKDNRLYRIEVHQGNPGAWFKWSRDNASVCAEVEVVGDTRTYKLKNSSTHVQEAFRGAAWIELSAPGETGLMYDMSNTSNSFEVEDDILTLAVPTPNTPTLGFGEPRRAGKTIIRRWDGVFPRERQTNSLVSELGVSNLQYDNEGFYRIGDYWLILVRNGKIENWEAGTPKQADGVEHHFVALGFLDRSDDGIRVEPLHVQFDPLTSPNLSTTENLRIGGNLTVGSAASSATDGRQLNVYAATTIGTSGINRTLTVNGDTSISGDLTANTANFMKDTTIGGNLLATTGNFSTPENPMELLSLGVTPQSLVFDSGIADSKTVAVFSKTNWTARSSATAWCTVTKGSGDKLATVDVRENGTTASRTATVAFRTSDGLHTRTMSVTQPPLLTPVISGFIPSEAARGAALSIFGGHFNPVPGKNVVRLNGIPAETVVAASATQLTVTVPQNRYCSGKITVEVGSKSAISAATFSYMPIVTVSTLAGSHVRGYDDGIGSAAQFSNPYGITVDAENNLYVVDYSGYRIRKVTPSGEVSTLAGSVRGFADGKGNEARFDCPSGITIDESGNLYVADGGNHRIRKVTPLGEVSTLAGSVKGFANGKGNEARFDFPSGITIDKSGNLYVADTNNHCIRKVTPSGEVSTFAGSGMEGFADDRGSAARFYRPQGITIDAEDNLYVADTWNCRIRKVTRIGGVSTLAGSSGGFADGTGSAAQFYRPRGICIDTEGNLYVADFESHNIRKVTSSGVAVTIAGNSKGLSTSGNATFADGMGSAAQFSNPMDITVDTEGNLYVADSTNHRIRKIVLE